MSIFGKKDERGLVSFMITIVMMVVISLIVVGFTQVTNRNRRQALDRQLSAQAFYAAESGVNAAVATIRARQAAGQPVLAQNTCGGGASTYPAATLNTDPLVRYTCVMVDPFVPDLKVTPGEQSSSVIRINPVNASGDPVNLTQLTFSWPYANVGSSNINDCSTPNTYRTTVLESCGYALVRVDLLQYSSQTTANALANSTVTLYLQPVSSGGSTQNIVSFSTVRAIRVAAACSNLTRRCTGTITLSGGASSQNYYARISALYRDPGTVVVNGRSAAGVVRFRDSQASIDVTGKAVDVLRRVQVRVPLGELGGDNVPPGAVYSSATICKRFTASDLTYHSECGP